MGSRPFLFVFPWIARIAVVLTGLLIIGACIGTLVIALAYPNLPDLSALTDYRPSVPLQVYTAEGVLIGEFGIEHRSLVSIRDVPQQLKNAIVAAEDDRFYQHGGVDYQGVLRAAYANLVSGGAKQGASTITMQVARNFFLSSEKTLTRKLYEALLAFKIEQNLNKERILELYVNQIYLGRRSYGFAAAAQSYFAKPLNELTLGECAMLAGLPKAPSAYNPSANPQRAKQRQQYVLRRMKELGYIAEQQYADALKLPLNFAHGAQQHPIHADYVAEMVRQAIYERYPQDAYRYGFRVYSTLRAADQEAAYRALRDAVIEYDRLHGYRGPEAQVQLQAQANEDDFDEALADHPDSDDVLAALVLAADTREVKAALRDGQIVTISGNGLRFSARSLGDKAPSGKGIKRGSVIRVKKGGDSLWEIVQLPEVESAFIAIDPSDGTVRALVGGFDFGRNKFNHVTQAWRQPGSSFKPFIYSAALEKGFTPATIIPDEPIVLEAEATGSQRWEPKNFDGKFEGPMRMRTALAKSKNMVSIRILQSIGPKYAQDYVTRFGFDADKQPPFLTLALGVGSVTPWQMARAYAVFANGGCRIEPYFIQKIVNDRGETLGTAEPNRADNDCQRVIDMRNAFVMDSMMHDVVRYGTAARAMSLGRDDLAGKTGSTNDFVDAWFCGFQPTLVGIAWVGYDRPRSLGRNETGGRVALPIWTAYMRQALKDTPQMALRMPQGIVQMPINDGGPPVLGGRAEYFYEEYAPGVSSASLPDKPIGYESPNSGESAAGSIPRSDP